MIDLAPRRWPGSKQETVELRLWLLAAPTGLTESQTEGEVNANVSSQSYTSGSGYHTCGGRHN
jgi:hypothetical protein